MEDNATNPVDSDSQVMTEETAVTDNTADLFAAGDLQNILIFSLVGVLLLVILLIALVANKRKRERQELDSFVDDGRPLSERQEEEEEALAVVEEDRDLKKKG